MSRANRPKRTPIGTRNVLTTEQRDGFVRRWVNDIDDRVQMFMDAGYEVVKDSSEVGDPRAGDAKQVGKTKRKPVGGGTYAVLMQIPKEYYDEDQAEKQQRVDKTEEALIPQDQTNLYGEGISIKRENVKPLSLNRED